MLAKVTLRPPIDATGGGNLRVTGKIRGPFCANAQTLPTDFLVTHSPDSAGPLGAASVIDPCYWTPELPMTYEVAIQVIDGERVVSEHCTTVGFSGENELVIDS